MLSFTPLLNSSASFYNKIINNKFKDLLTVVAANLLYNASKTNFKNHINLTLWSQLYFQQKNIKRRKSQKQPLQQKAFEDFPPRMQNTMKKLLIKRMTWNKTFQMKRSYDL